MLQKNTSDSQFCLECGAALKPGTEKEFPTRTVPAAKKTNFIDEHPTLAKIPGFRSGTGWKMIRGVVGYFLIAIIVIFTILSVI